MDIVWRTEPVAEPSSWLMVYEWAGEPSVSVARLADAYLVRCHGVADFRVAIDGTSAEGFLLAGVLPERAEAAFVQQVLPATFQLSGTFALHASAVATEAGTVAFVGPSGAGKSSLAAMLAVEGWCVVADDSLPIALTGDGPRALPTRGPVRLRRPTAEQLGEGAWHWGKWAVTRPRLENPSPLTRVYAIGATSEDVRITPMSRREGALLLASNLHRMDHLDPKLLASELDFVEATTAQVQVLELGYPRRFDVVDEVREAIRADLGLVNPGRP